MPGNTVRLVPLSGLLDRTHICAGVVVGDGDQVNSLFERLCTMSGGIISTSAQGDSTVWTCRSARNFFIV